MYTVARLRCSCHHDFQNSEYGIGIRIHNLAMKGYNGSKGWRCTVCLDVKPYSTGGSTE